MGANMSTTTSRLALLLGIPLLAALAPALADANVRNLVQGDVCSMSFLADRRGEDPAAPGGRFNVEYHGGVGMIHDFNGPKLITCPVIRSLPISTLGLSDLELRLSNRNADPVSVLCTATASRTDGTIVSLVSHTVTVPGSQTGVVDWADGVGSPGSKGMYGIDCQLPGNVAIVSVYTSEKDGLDN
jgi:hypothetical protein